MSPTRADPLARANLLALAQVRASAQVHIGHVLELALAVDHDVVARGRLVLVRLHPAGLGRDDRLAALRHQVLALVASARAEPVAVGVLGPDRKDALGGRGPVPPPRRPRRRCRPRRCRPTAPAAPLPRPSPATAADCYAPLGARTPPQTPPIKSRLLRRPTGLAVGLALKEPAPPPVGGFAPNAWFPAPAAAARRDSALPVIEVAQGSDPRRRSRRQADRRLRRRPPRRSADGP